MFRVWPLLCALLVATLSGCTGDESSSSAGQIRDSAQSQRAELGQPGFIPSLDGKWTVTKLIGRDGKTVLLKGQALPRLKFADGEMSGSTGGCNDVFGAYEQGGESGQNLVFPRMQLGSTLVGCREAPIVTRLLDVRHVSGSPGILYLHSDDWIVIAELRPR